MNTFSGRVTRFFRIVRNQGINAALRRTKKFIVRVISGRASKPYNRISGIFGRPGSSMIIDGAKISILMPVYNTPPNILDEAIQSVLNQTYPDWELCICDDASSLQRTVNVLQKYKGSDPRIKITRAPRNLHISNATNLAAQFATGDFVAFLDHDDTLEPDALEVIARTLKANPEADVLYTDEDKIEPDGCLSEPYLKPDWSPEHLLSVMYILHFFVVRKSLFLDLGGLRNEFTGAQDYDLALRATDKARQVVHIPKVLYHWRKLRGSSAGDADAKPAALSNAHRAVEDFVISKTSGATVSDGLFPGSFRAQYPVDESRPVTLLILTDSGRREVAGRGNIPLLEHTVTSIVERSTFRNYRIIVVDNGKMSEAVRERYAQAGIEVNFYHLEGAFNYAKKVNYALKLVETEDVIILNDDLEVIAPDWIEALLSFSRRPDIGAVGGMLLYPNNRIQHAGVVLGVNGLSAHLFHNLPSDEAAYCGFNNVIRNYSAVTGAVLATRMSVIREIDGFNEALAIDYNDIDFCLRLREAGYRIVYTPFAKLYHFEGSTLVRQVANQRDKNNFVVRWGSAVERDPYYNPGLPKNRTDCDVTQW